MWHQRLYPYTLMATSQTLLAFTDKRLNVPLSLITLAGVLLGRDLCCTLAPSLPHVTRNGKNFPVLSFFMIRHPLHGQSAVTALIPGRIVGVMLLHLRFVRDKDDDEQARKTLLYQCHCIFTCDAPCSTVPLNNSKSIACLLES